MFHLFVCLFIICLLIFAPLVLVSSHNLILALIQNRKPAKTLSLKSDCRSITGPFLLRFTVLNPQWACSALTARTFWVWKAHCSFPVTPALGWVPESFFHLAHLRCQCVCSLALSMNHLPSLDYSLTQFRFLMNALKHKPAERPLCLCSCILQDLIFSDLWTWLHNFQVKTPSLWFTVLYSETW